MTCWLERGESRFLDLITSTVYGLVIENQRNIIPDKYTLFTSGSQVYSLFKNLHPTILESQIKNFASLAQGRYIREFAYVLLALDFCDDLFATRISKIKINNIQDFKKEDYTEFIQSKKSKYWANKSALAFSKLDFASTEWADMLTEKMLSYGYFCRYLDVIELIEEKNKKYLKKEQVFINQLKNVIGPFDHRVKGSGPDFVQETFKSWAFFLNIINLETGGKLEEYTKEDRLNYLKRHTGYISDGKDAYIILRNLKKSKITINSQPKDKIRVMSFMRLVNLEGWKREYNMALFSALRRLRILFFTNNRQNKEIKISKLYDDKKLKSIIKYFKKDFSILWDLIYLECMGMKFKVIYKRDIYSSVTDFILEKTINKKGHEFLSDLKRVNIKSIYFESAWSQFKEINTKDLKIVSLRQIEVENFNKYCPQGNWIKWIQKN